MYRINDTKFDLNLRCHQPDCRRASPRISTPSSFLPRYFLTSFYTKYDTTHFVINTASLLSVLIPKLPQLHGVRILGINKY